MNLRAPLRCRVACFGLAFVAAGYLQATMSAARPPVAQSPSNNEQLPGAAHRALLNKYCVTCHNQKTKTAGLMLDTIDVERVSGDAEILEKVVRKLRSGAMPPPGRPRPDKVAYDAIASWLETALDQAAAAHPNPGRESIHRLNRVEYANVIRDLLGLEIESRSSLPVDDSGYGFENIADVLSVTPGLLDRYLLTARKVSRLAVGEPTIRAAVETYKVPYFRFQGDRMDEDLPFGSRGGIVVRHNFPADGEYLFKVRLQKSRNGNVRGLAEVNTIDVRIDGERVKVFTVGGKAHETKTDQYVEGDYQADDLVVQLPVKAGPRMIGITFQKRTWATEGVGPTRLPASSSSFPSATNTSVEYGRIDMGVDSVDVRGPFAAQAPKETPSRQRIFACYPGRSQDEVPCAKTILSALARRAYRRPVTTGDMRTVLGFYNEGRREGTFDAGIQRALTAILVDPEFLFRFEAEPPSGDRRGLYPITDLGLASRLSFFLWSSIPDDELLEAAARGTLNDRVVLEQQVRRMLRDTRARALVRNFFGQWLSVRNVATVTPDPKVFPEFDEELRAAFQRETELFIESQLREDRNAVELLTANYSFLNERLARHYGISNVYGSHFRRVSLPDNRRAGVLGQASVLTVTSYAHRTSPVLRGKWLLENLLGAPPPPPPPNVPNLPENGDGVKPTSVRGRMEQHRRNPGCASCHARLDPMGFALENFDGIGKWRSDESGAPIDPSGALVDGTHFDGPATFRDALIQHREEYVRSLLEKLLTYALGRGVEYYDMPAIRKISRDAAISDYRWSSLILGIAESMPFRMRRS